MTSRDDETPGPEEKQALLWDVVRNLNHQCVPHIVIGGNAVQHHVAEREPQDLDVWVQPSQENAARVADALIYSGFDYEDVTGCLANFMSDKGAVRLQHPASGVCLDVLQDVSGSELFGGFDEAYRNANVGMVNGQEYRYLDDHRLTINKIASWSEGREKDMNDARSLLDLDRRAAREEREPGVSDREIRELCEDIWGRGVEREPEAVRDREATPEPEKEPEAKPNRKPDLDWGHEW